MLIYMYLNLLFFNFLYLYEFHRKINVLLNLWYGRHGYPSTTYVMGLALVVLQNFTKMQKMFK